MSDTSRIRAAYTRFLQPGRILLTGHSHQAWPDVAREAQLAVFDDAARFVDDKWSEAIFPLVDEVGRGVLARMGFAPDGDIAFAESTHALLVRLFSAFDLGRAHVVTTTGEFHSLHRQLCRWSEDGLRVTWVEARPRATLAERLVAAIEAARGEPVVAAFSAVMFEDAWVMREVGEVVAAAERAGAVPLVDAYHAFNAVPLAWGGAAERAAFVVGGGYKYAAFGNGLCWLRVPPGCALRPADTGWFAAFGALGEARHAPAAGTAPRPVSYDAGGARFAGATFEASAFYRARAVLAHWDALGLDVPALRAISVRQTRRIVDGLRAAGVVPGALELASSDDDERRGAFVSLRHARAAALAAELKARGVWIDTRGELLRLGPAPYLLDEEIDRGVEVLAQLCQTGP